MLVCARAQRVQCVSLRTPAGGASARSPPEPILGASCSSGDSASCARPSCMGASWTSIRCGGMWRDRFAGAQKAGAASGRDRGARSRVLRASFGDCGRTGESRRLGNWVSSACTSRCWRHYHVRDRYFRQRTQGECPWREGVYYGGICACARARASSGTGSCRRRVRSPRPDHGKDPACSGTAMASSI